jgi:hypothetical protein
VAVHLVADRLVAVHLVAVLRAAARLVVACRAVALRAVARLVVACRVVVRQAADPRAVVRQECRQVEWMVAVLRAVVRQECRQAEWMVADLVGPVEWLVMDAMTMVSAAADMVVTPVATNREISVSTQVAAKVPRSSVKNWTNLSAILMRRSARSNVRYPQSVGIPKDSVMAPAVRAVQLALASRKAADLRVVVPVAAQVEQVAPPAAMKIRLARSME